MKKKLLLTFMLLALVLIAGTATPVFADEAVTASGVCSDDGKVKWTLNNHVLTISGEGVMTDYITCTDYYTGEILSSTVVPWQSYEDSIYEVVIENGVTQIGYAAFADLYYLKKATIASSVKNIRHDVFANDRSLKEVTIYPGLESMEADIFYGTAITELTLPSTLTSLQETSLAGMWSLKSINIAGTGGTYISRDGILFADGGKTLVTYPADHGTTYTIPSYVTKIADDAFSQSKLTSIVIPDTVTSVGDFAFCYCEDLESITFSANQATIERYTCFYCPKLTEVIIPEGIAKIEDYAFMDCPALSQIVLPSTVTSVGKDIVDSNAYVDTSKTDLIDTGGGSYIQGTYLPIKATDCYGYAFEVLDLVNKERAAEGLAALTMDQSLLKSAMYRAHEIVVSFSHTRPCGSDCFSVNSLMFGENIAMGQGSPASVMDSWMNSSGHRANILGSYESIGIGCVYYGGTYYWVQCFGSELSVAADRSSYQDVTVTENVLVPKGYVFDDDSDSSTSSYSNKTSGGSSTTVRPGKVKILSLSALKGKKVKLGWKKLSGVKYYEIQYSTNKKFKKGVKKIKVKSSLRTKTISKLKKGKRYYVRVRAYNKYGKYGLWSKVRSVKVKK